MAGWIYPDLVVNLLRAYSWMGWVNEWMNGCCACFVWFYRISSDPAIFSRGDVAISLYRQRVAFSPVWAEAREGKRRGLGAEFLEDEFLGARSRSSKQREKERSHRPHSPTPQLPRDIANLPSLLIPYVFSQEPHGLNEWFAVRLKRSIPPHCRGERVVLFSSAKFSQLVG